MILNEKASRLYVIARQFGQYLLVGGLAFVVDYATLFLMASHAGLHYLLAATAGFTLGLITNYLLCIGWIFDHRSMESKASEFTAFTLIGFAGLALNNALMYIATDLAGIHYLVSKLLAAAYVLVFNFGLRRYFLFTDYTKNDKQQGDMHGEEGADCRRGAGWADRCAGIAAPVGSSTAGRGGAGDGGGTGTHRGA